MRRIAWLLGLVMVCATAHAQMQENALSDTEVEKLRDTAYVPPQRVEAFIGFLNLRVEEIDKVSAGPRKPGREEDIHDAMAQFNSIGSDLDDNLEEYGKMHKDIRKVLPKVLAAAERWATALKTPPDHEAYKVERKLALETLDDIRQTVKELIEEQKAWFLAHPPVKEGKGTGGG